jgi:drug/metabolite transporter (DMT)-like permease
MLKVNCLYDLRDCVSATNGFYATSWSAGFSAFCRASCLFRYDLGYTVTFSRPPAALWAFILVSVAAQLLNKASGLHVAEARAWIDAWLLNPYLCAAIACYGIGLFCWMRVLAVMPLSSAYPWTALIYVLTPVAAVLLWQEQLSATYLVGMACILCGISLATKARAK